MKKAIMASIIALSLPSALLVAIELSPATWVSR